MELFRNKNGPMKTRIDEGFEYVIRLSNEGALIFLGRKCKQHEKFLNLIDFAKCVFTGKDFWNTMNII